MALPVRRILKIGAAGLFVLMLAGVTYQGVATALERRIYPYPGRLVPVGDHQLHIQCLGTGQPTVVLEAGALGFSASWSTVVDPLSATTRVCAYDRAGLGWSEARDRGFDSNAVADELRQLLHGAHEPPPFLLVGDEMGGIFVAQFAGRYAAETTRIVLIDSPLNDGSVTRARAPSPWLARTGLLRLGRLLLGAASPVPGPPGSAAGALGMRPDHLARAAQEIRGVDKVRATVDVAAVPRTIPISTLTLGSMPPRLATQTDVDQIVLVVRDAVREWRRAR